MKRFFASLSLVKPSIQLILSLLLVFCYGCVKTEETDVYFVDILESIKDDKAKDLNGFETMELQLYGNDYALIRFAIETHQTSLTNLSIDLESDLPLDQWMDGYTIYQMDPTMASPLKNGPSYPYLDVMNDTVDRSVEHNGIRQYVLVVETTDQMPMDSFDMTIKIDADQFEKPKALAIQINPVNTRLEDGFTIELWQHPFTSAWYYDLETFGIEHQMILSSMLTEYASMGGHMLTATVVDEVWNHQSYDSDPSLIQWIRQEDGSFRFDYTYFDLWVSLGLTSDVLDPSNPNSGIKAYSIAPWNNQISYLDEASHTTIDEVLEVGSQPWIYYWTTFLEDFMVHCESLNIEGLIYIAMDERDATTLQACIDLIHSIQSGKGESFKISAAINSNLIDQWDLLDQIDDISFSLVAIDDHIESFEALCSHRDAIGLTTTIYTTTGQYPSSFVTSDPADTLFSLLYSYRFGANGFLRWSYDGWNEDPLINADYGDFQSGDPFLVYPKEELVEPYITPSYRLLLIRYGLSMIHRIEYLKQQGDSSILSKLQTWVYPRFSIDSNQYATFASPFERLQLNATVANLIDALQ